MSLRDDRNSPWCSCLLRTDRADGAHGSGGELLLRTHARGLVDGGEGNPSSESETLPGRRSNAHRVVEPTPEIVSTFGPARPTAPRCPIPSGSTTALRARDGQYRAHPNTAGHRHAGRYHPQIDCHGSPHTPFGEPHKMSSTIGAL
jgi:hypothetical protein